MILTCLENPGYVIIPTLYPPRIHKKADPARRAVRGLNDGTLAVTIIRHTENEIRAAVKNGHGLTVMASR